MSTQHHLKNNNKYIAIKICFFLVIVVNTLTTSLSYAVEPSLRFDRISIEDGLSQRNVQTIFQDSRGFLWVGTWEGLNRYDGYSFKIFRNDPENTNSISDNMILEIIEDQKGFLWIATRNGLNRFDPKTELFTRFQHDENDPHSISDNDVLNLAEDENGTLWVGTRAGGLNRLLSEDSKRFFRYPYQDSSTAQLSSLITELYVEGNILWIGTKKGLRRLNTKENSFVHYRHSKENLSTLSDDFVLAITEDSNGQLWVSTINGLNKYDDESDNFIRLSQNQTEETSLINQTAPALYGSGNGILWIGTVDGLSRYNLKNNSFSNNTHNTTDPHSLSTNNISVIFGDRTGVIWFGLREGGLNRLPPLASNFFQYRHDPDGPHGLYDNNIMSVVQDSAGNIWSATKRGLNLFEPTYEKYSKFRHSPKEPSSLPHDRVYALLVDKKSRLWVGTEDGLARLNTENGQFIHYKNQEPNTQSINENYITALKEDSKGQIWVGTFYDGLNWLDLSLEKSNGFPHHNIGPSSLGEQYVSTLLEDKYGKIWIGTWGSGLNRLDPKTKRLFRYYRDSSEFNSLSHDTVNALLEDKEGTIWIATSGGLNRFVEDSESFTHYGKKHGLSNEVIMTMLEDDDGYLWLGTNQGISKFDPKTEKAINYYTDDGLFSSEYNSASFKKRNGEFLFGSVNGITQFHPQDIKLDLQPPIIAFTEFFLFNRPVLIKRIPNSSHSTDVKNSESTPETFMLNQAINETKHLILTHKESAFSFEFAALHFANPKMNQYAYRLEGWDKNWINTDYKNRRATYTNIPAGDYVFRVKASNRDGVWNEKGKSIKISILPPPWKTWWAYTFYFIATLSILTLIILLIYRRQLAEKDRASALEISSAKDKLFANVSHEFRTPLTLILGPLEKIIHEPKTREFNYELSLIKRNGQRLLGMVDQLLDLARLQGDQPSERQPQDIRKTVDFIVRSFESMAIQKQISLQLNLKSETPFWVSMIPDALEKLLTNLITNAFKYTPAGGRVSVTVEQINSKTTSIKISDTGCGIKPEDQQRIFSHFTRLENTASHTPGAGIGLALVKELVESHGGSISVKSALGQGSTFIVSLPLHESKSTANINKDDRTTPMSSSKEIIGLALAELHTVNPIKPVLDNNVAEKSSVKSSILIIEDNNDLQEYIVGLLNEKYQCLTAVNGKLGLKAAIEHIPDLIISDVMMPEMNGYELSHTVKNDERTSHVPVILLTARGDKDSRLRGWQEHADEYLTKPFDSDELIVRIENLLSIRNILRQKFSNSIFQSETVKTQGNETVADSNQKKEAIFITKLDKIVSEHYANPELKVNELALQIAMSERQLSRKLSGVLGITPTEYIRRFRLERARALLISGKAVGLVFVEVGFSSQSYFGKCFKAQYGKQPSEYREK